MTISAVGSLYIVDEINDLIDSGGLKNQRLITMLKELVLSNENIYRVNVAALRLKDGELSETDMLIYLNQFRASKGSIAE